MSNQPQNTTPSKILLDEQFASEDSGFVETLKQFHSASFLVNFLPRWLSDRRPWARQQIVEYLSGDLNYPGHEVLVKRIFKHFLHQRDHEMMSQFFVSFDRIVRRRRVRQQHFDWSNRRAPRSWLTERLYAAPNKTVINETERTGESVYLGKKYTFRLPDQINQPSNRLFSNTTRAYLRRATWRYFRHLSYRQPAAYVEHVAKALEQFQDADFRSGENIIDNWSLMHACFFHHDAIVFGPTHTNLREGRSLGELSAAPYQPIAWQTERAFNVLLPLLTSASSRLVRLWSIELLTQVHAERFGKIELPQVFDLLASADPSVQEFATRIFMAHPGLSRLTVKQWLELIKGSHISLLSLICEQMKTHVTPDRLSDQQAIELACAQQVPVASLGFDLLLARHIKSRLDDDELRSLAGVGCAQLAPTIAAWALNELAQARNKRDQVDDVIDFFDSPLTTMRTAALKWLESSDRSLFDDPELWARLIETPFDDVRLQVVSILDRRQARPDLEADSLVPVWASVILNVQRGGRTKPKAIQQLADRLIQVSQEAAANRNSRPSYRSAGDTDPADRLSGLLAVLAIAVRSVRAPEMRAALAAIVQLHIAAPTLRPLIAERLPELEFASTEVTS